MQACIEKTGGTRGKSSHAWEMRKPCIKFLSTAYTHISSCDVNAIRPPESSGQYNNKEVVIKYGGVGEWV
jgi:hypothetical protein